MLSRNFPAARSRSICSDARILAAHSLRSSARDRGTQLEHCFLAHELDAFSKFRLAVGVGGLCRREAFGAGHLCRRQPFSAGRLCRGQASAQAAHYGSKNIQFFGMIRRGFRRRLDDDRLARNCIYIGYFLPHIFW